VETLERALRDRSQEDDAASVLVGTALNDDDHAGSRCHPHSKRRQTPATYQG
jgi:hypothetical protein